MERLDHLGIVAGVCQEIGLAAYVVELGGPSQQQVRVGTATVAMILNGLGFSNRQLYLVSEFFATKPVEQRHPRHRAGNAGSWCGPARAKSGRVRHSSGRWSRRARRGKRRSGTWATSASPASPMPKLPSLSSSRNGRRGYGWTASSLPIPSRPDRDVHARA